MMTRAIFWVGLVSVLVPREPDLGLALQHQTETPPFSEGSAEGATETIRDGTIAPVNAWPVLVWTFRQSALRAIPKIRAELETSLNDRIKNNS